MNIKWNLISVAAAFLASTNITTTIPDSVQIIRWSGRPAGDKSQKQQSRASKWCSHQNVRRIIISAVILNGTFLDDLSVCLSAGLTYKCVTIYICQFSRSSVCKRTGKVYNCEERTTLYKNQLKIYTQIITITIYAFLLSNQFASFCFCRRFPMYCMHPQHNASDTNTVKPEWASFRWIKLLF